MVLKNPIQVIASICHKKPPPSFPPFSPRKWGDERGAGVARQYKSRLFPQPVNKGFGKEYG
jgi:hypothetical protein